MFTDSTHVIGNFEIVKLASKPLGLGFSVIPGHGGALHNLSLHQGQSQLIEFGSEQDILADMAYKNALLFPFPNRLGRGTYEFEGHTYHFPMNEKVFHNALHGFFYDQKMAIIEIVKEADVASMTLLYTYKGDLAYYPFACELQVKYTLTARAEFTIELTVTNTGSGNMPVGLGWHPYFKLPAWEEAELQLPPVKKVEIDELMLPTGAETNFEVFKEFAPIAGHTLDNCFRLVTPGKRLASLRSKAGNLVLHLDAPNADTGFIQLFTPPTADRLAVEPVTANINAFQSGDGLRVVQPGQSYQWLVQVAVQPLS